MSTSETTTAMNTYEHLTTDEAAMDLGSFKQHAASILCFPIFQPPKIIEYGTNIKKYSFSAFRDYLHATEKKTSSIRYRALAIDPEKGLTQEYKKEIENLF